MLSILDTEDRGVNRKSSESIGCSWSLSHSTWEKRREPRRQIINKQANKWEHFDGIKSEKNSVDTRTVIGVERGYSMSSGLNSDNKVIVYTVVAGVLVCPLVFWFVDVVLASSSSRCCGTSSRRRGRGTEKRQCMQWVY